MRKLSITLILALVIGISMAPAIASAGIGPCPGQGTGNPISMMPLYKNVLSDVVSLKAEVEAALAGCEGDTSQVEGMLDEINDIVASATVGSNYIYQKDQLLLAKAKLEELLCML